MKSGVYVIGAIVVVLLLWLVPAAWNFSSHAANVKTTLEATIAHYKMIGETDAAPLYAAAGGQEPDASSVQKLIAAFSAVTRASSTPDQWKAVDALQKNLGDFFAPATQHANSVSSNPHFVTLNQEITGHGGASTLVLEYNKAASVVQEDMKSFPGNMLGNMSFGGQPPFLYLDGKPRDIKVML